MVVKGVLERKQDPDNRRRVLITVAKQAQKFQKTIERELIKELEKIANNMSKENFNKWVESNQAIDQAIDDIYGS